MDTVGGCSLRYVVIIMKENIHIEEENIFQITHLTVKLMVYTNVTSCLLYIYFKIICVNLKINK